MQTILERSSGVEATPVLDHPVLTLHFTPAEWRALLADRDFLRDPDNGIRPRRLMGLPVEIVPDHRTAVLRAIDRGVRAVALACAVSAATMAAAHAQDEVVTANHSRPMPVEQVAGPAVLPVHDEDAVFADAPAPPRDGKVHGMVEASVGTNGYRHGRVVLVAPLGDEGVVAVDVSQTQLNLPGRR